ncbi:hypothetical protein GGI43DRAFT_221957 [Trichoderma evansii]
MLDRSLSSLSFVSPESLLQELTLMNFLAEVLKPIPVVVWGGPALEHCGVKAFFYGYFFIVNNCDLELAEAKLLSAGCIRAPWSWGSCDPARLETHGENVKRSHEKSIPEYEDIDNNSVRFAFPPESVQIMNEPITLILPSFVGLGPPRAAALEYRELAQEETQDDDIDKGLDTEQLVQNEDTLQDTA